MSNAPRLAPLRVASHVRLCVCEGSIIVLDLRRGRYWNLGASASNALAGLVQGWPSESASCGASDASGTSPAFDAPIDSVQSARPTGHGMSATDAETRRATSAHDLTRHLLSLGILTQCVSAPPTYPVLEPARASLYPMSSPNPLDALNSKGPLASPDTGQIASPVDARRLFNFLWSGTAAAWALRVATLHDIALRVATRRDRLTRAREHAPHRALRDCGEPWADAPSQAMRSAALSFERLRPLAFSARDRCLHDSLSLVGFLAAEGLCARWVIGVKTRPFGAYSWVQAGSTVLNDQHERVRAFRPILVV